MARSHVLLVGVGALGTHAASHLVRAGIGRLTLVDRDVVDLSNLQRQVLFDEADAHAATPKAIAARAHLRMARRDAEIDAIVADFDREVFSGLGARPDLIVDGTDNFTTRYLINDLAIDAGVPWIYGGAVGSTGSAAVVIPGQTPCLRCWMPAAPPIGEVGNCETLGVLAPAVALVAAFQVAEAIKVLAGHHRQVTRGMFTIDVWSGSYGVRLQHSSPQPSCSSCGTRELPALHAPPADLVTLCGRDAVQVRPAAGQTIDLERLAARLTGAVDALDHTPSMLRFSVEGCRISVFRDGRALLFGVTGPDRARILYDRWVGAT